MPGFAVRLQILKAAKQPIIFELFFLPRFAYANFAFYSTYVLLYVSV